MDYVPDYEDADFIEVFRGPLASGETSHVVRHKASGNVFGIRATDLDDFRAKLAVGDWEPHPLNETGGDEAAEDD